MRVKPTPVVAIGLFLSYAAVVAVIWSVNEVDYESVAESSEAVVKGILVPVGVGAVFLAVAATWLGWWGPAMAEGRTGPRWGAVVPRLLVVIALSGVVTIDLGAASAGTLLLLALGTALVGFSEELLTRGLMIVGFRGTLSEGAVWFLSSALFGLLHGLNVFFGQSVGATIRQILFAFLLGTAFYVTRRLTGMLVVTMVIHAIWDFGTLGTEHSGAEASLVGGLLIWPTVVLAFVVLVKVLRSAPSMTPLPARVDRR